jgi:hypothetical protein
VIGFSWNLEWSLCHQSLFQIRTTKFLTIGNTNVTDAQSSKLCGGKMIIPHPEAVAMIHLSLIKSISDLPASFQWQI